MAYTRLQAFITLLLNPVLILHSLNLATTTLCHREAARISGYPGGINTYFQPHFSMEDLRFGIGYALVMVVLHLVLSGGYYTTVSKGRERADPEYWEDNEVG